MNSMVGSSLSFAALLGPGAFHCGSSGRDLDPD